MSQPVVIAGISTEVGKTVIAALLVEAWQADYWKPVQSGSATDSDTRSVEELVSNMKSRFHPEAYSMEAPISPHEAARLEGVQIELQKIVPPQTENKLVVELAGGLMSPLTDEKTNIDLLEQWKFPVVLVVDGYLGSINHSLLSIEALHSRNIPLKVLVFNRFEGWAGKDVMLEKAGHCPHFDVPEIKPLDKETLKAHAQNVPTEI